MIDVPAVVENPRILPKPIRQFSIVLAPTDSITDFPIAAPRELLDAQPSRRLHFAAGRYCATRAMTALDPALAASAIERGVDGEPVWPAGIVGSITHSGAFVSAAAARAEDAAGVGIDTQELLTKERLAHVSPVILAATEIERAERSTLGPSLWITVAFCAKEALFKCLYPAVRRRFYYSAAEVVSIDQATSAKTDGTLTIALTESLGREFSRGSMYEGRFELSRDYAHAGVWRPAGGAIPIR